MTTDARANLNLIWLPSSWPDPPRPAAAGAAQALSESSYANLNDQDDHDGPGCHGSPLFKAAVATGLASRRSWNSEPCATSTSMIVSQLVVTIYNIIHRVFALCPLPGVCPPPSTLCPSPSATDLVLCRQTWSVQWTSLPICRAATLKYASAPATSDFKGASMSAWQISSLLTRMVMITDASGKPELCLGCIITEMMYDIMAKLLLCMLYCHLTN